MRELALSALTLAVATVAVPASAHHDGTEEQPTLRTERVYFKCVDGLKAQNVPALQGTYPTWSTEPPAGSVTDGEGCGQYENLLTNANNDNPFDLVVKGTFTGNLDAINVELHNIYVGTARDTGNFDLRAKLYIDGFEYANVGPVTVNPEPSDTGISEKLTYSFRDIGLTGEHGDGTIEREVAIYVGSFTEIQSIWVWDTTEVPAGLTFNPETLEQPSIIT